MNIYLIGYRCTGKTTVGQALAKRLGREFIDADDYLEAKAGRSIQRIFAEDGEPAFRKLECEVIAELAGRSNTIIAAGGGAVLNEANVQQMKQSGVCVLLEADAKTIHERMQADVRTALQRPSLTDKNPYAEIEHLLAFRRPYYDRAADLRFDTAKVSFEDVVEAIGQAAPEE